MRKPTPDEFDVSDEGVAHRPTEYSFRPFPGDPTHGSVRMGLLDKEVPEDERYDPEEVKRMARRLWSKRAIVAGR
jgi:hypothetical protein